MLPQPEPRAVRELIVVPAIGSSDVACAEWPNIRRFEHFLQLLNLVNDALNIHASPIIYEKAGMSQTEGHWWFVSESCSTNQSSHVRN